MTVAEATSNTVMADRLESSFYIINTTTGFHREHFELRDSGGALADTLLWTPDEAFLWSNLRLRIVLFIAATHAFQSYPVSFSSKDG